MHASAQLRVCHSMLSLRILVHYLRAICIALRCVTLLDDNVTIAFRECALLAMLLGHVYEIQIHISIQKASTST